MVTFNIKYNGQFLWCPNPLHGMYDYHKNLENGFYQCQTCKAIWRLCADRRRVLQPVIMEKRNESKGLDNQL